MPRTTSKPTPRLSKARRPPLSRPGAQRLMIKTVNLICMVCMTVV